VPGRTGTIFQHWRMANALRNPMPGRTGTILYMEVNAAEGRSTFNCLPHADVGGYHCGYRKENKRTMFLT